MIFGMMVVTFGVRYPILALAGKVTIPATVERALRYVPVAVLTAISIPIMFRPAGDWDISLSNAHLIAGLLSMVIAWRTRHLLLTISLGMLIFLVLQFY